MLRKRRTVVLSPCFLSGVVVVLGTCGAFFLLQFLSRVYNRRTSWSDFSSEKSPVHEFQRSGRCEVCYTEECLRTAAAVLEMINPAVDPCEDFYLFACGGYKKVATESREREVYSWAVEDEAVKIFRDLIKQIPTHVPEGTPGSSVTKIRKFYDSCMDTVTSEEAVVQTALKYLEHFGMKHWPDLSNDFRFTDPDLDEVLVRLALYEQNPFFQVQLEFFPPKNETASATSFDFGSELEMKIKVSDYADPTIHEDGIVKEETMILVEEILKHFEPNMTARSDILKNVLSFDLELHNLQEKTMNKEQRCRQNSTSDCSSNLSYDCFQETNEQMNRWCRLADKMLDRSGFLKKNISMTVLLKDKEHFQELGLLIDRTNQRVIAHALAIQFFSENGYFLNSALSRLARLPEDGREIPMKYFFEIPEIGRSEFCTVWVSYRMPILAEIVFFASKYNNSKLRKEVNEIYSSIKEISLSRVLRTPWIDTEAKKAVEELYSKIYFAPENRLRYLQNLSEVDELYKEVIITEGNFLANELEARKLKRILYLRNMDNLGKIMDYSAVPFKFNPMYDGPPWSIVFEFGNLVFPAVTSNRPRYINLGYFGVVMGHELSHPVEITIFRGVYENKSQIFDNAVQESKECFANHYSQYEIYGSGEKVEGNSSFNENLADYLGISVAFQTLRKYQEDHGFDEMLPGLHFNPEQMFFITAAQNWCDAHTPEGLKYYLTDFHSPPNVRVLGVYRNLDAFSEAFSCPSGSPMNPINKCRFE